MSRAYSLFQLWHSPLDTRLLLSITKGPYLIPSARSYPGLCFCKGLQTSTYEVVKGSYVPPAQIKQESKTEVVFRGFDISFVSCTHLIGTQTYCEKQENDMEEKENRGFSRQVLYICSGVSNCIITCL